MPPSDHLQAQTRRTQAFDLDADGPLVVVGLPLTASGVSVRVNGGKDLCLRFDVGDAALGELVSPEFYRRPRELTFESGYTSIPATWTDGTFWKHGRPTLETDGR
jgi:hypothetical protein